MEEDSVFLGTIIRWSPDSNRGGGIVYQTLFEIRKLFDLIRVTFERLTVEALP